MKKFGTIKTLSIDEVFTWYELSCPQRVPGLNHFRTYISCFFVTSPSPASRSFSRTQFAVQVSIPKAIFRFYLLFAVLSSGLPVAAQKVIILSGRVYNAADSTPLTGASVYLHESGKGTVTGRSGDFRLGIPAGRYRLTVSFLGYRQADTLITLQAPLKLDFHLEQEAISTQGVTVTAEQGNDYITSASMGEVRLTSREVLQLPSLLGESDPIKFLQLMPGVQSGSEAGVGFYVRGGGVDQNMVLLDNNLVYNPGHLMGFFSVFNPDMVRDVTLVKSGIPARYGGRLSSVVSVRSYSGRSDSLQVRGQIGLIASRLTVNSSLNRQKGSFIVSARLAYPDLLVKPAMVPFLKGSSGLLSDSRYKFHDFNAGFSHRLGSRDYLRISGHYGEDRFSMNRQGIGLRNRLDWGNRLVSAEWDHIFNDRISASNTLSYTRYNFKLSGSQTEYSFGLFSSVTDMNYKGRLSAHTGRHTLAAGTDLTRHTFTPNRIDVTSGSLVAEFMEFSDLFAWQGGVYAEDDMKLTREISAGAGLRFSFFNQVGPYTEYLKDEAFLVTDSVVYPAGESLAFYRHLEPRVSVRWQAGQNASLKASYTRMAQYVHLATSSSVSLPMDAWLPSDRIIRPQVGDQLSIGYYRKLLGDQFESSIELYFKNSRNQMEFINGIINNSISMTLQENIATGSGKSYGSEFFVRRRTGRTTGWISYTLSKTVRQFERINAGKVYPAKYDRRHDLSVAAVHRINDLWNISAVFIYVSGSAMTIPSGRYIIQGNVVNEYGDVNGFRMPAYHRLDVSLARERIYNNRNHSTWNFSVYNVYNRANPFYIYFETTGNLQEYRLEVDAVMVSMFPVIPSVSWSFTF